MFLVDSHCHLDGLDYESLHKDVDDVLAKAAARDVKFCLAVATTLPGYLHILVACIHSTRMIPTM